METSWGLGSASTQLATRLLPRSVLEIMSNGFYSGELGPSTIVAWREGKPLEG